MNGKVNIESPNLSFLTIIFFLFFEKWSLKNKKIEAIKFKGNKIAKYK